MHISFGCLYTNKNIILNIRFHICAYILHTGPFKGAICMIFSFLSECITQTCRCIFSSLWKYFFTPCCLQTKQLTDKNTWNSLLYWNISSSLQNWSLNQKIFHCFCFESTVWIQRAKRGTVETWFLHQCSLVLSSEQCTVALWKRQQAVFPSDSSLARASYT